MIINISQQYQTELKQNQSLRKREKETNSFLTLSKIDMKTSAWLRKQILSPLLSIKIITKTYLHRRVAIKDDSIDEEI